MTGSPPRRRPARVDTERAEAIAACAAHLADLRRECLSAPPDVALPPGRPRRIDPVPSSSFCTSPAELCAEIVR